MLNILHLSDLHYGLAGQKALLSNVSESWFHDLEILAKNCGPWDLILFTGDLVQKGSKEEYRELNANFFPKLMQTLDRLPGQFPPILLTVPGNHDLVRPTDDTAVVQNLLHPDRFHEIADKVFKKGSEYYRVIKKAFQNYSSWWEEHIKRSQKLFEHRGGSMTLGLMPGDFSFTFEKGGHRIGVVGLNTTFLQLADGNYQGKLAWHELQLNAVCSNNGAEWAEAHSIRLLLTHQGPKWLNAHSAENVMYEISPPGRFHLHLFGHEHELDTESRSVLGGLSRNLWQGASLFSMEKIQGPAGSPPMERRHGYSAGKFDQTRDGISLRMWPRKAVRTRGSGWRFIPDHEGCVLLERDSGTHQQLIRRARSEDNFAATESMSLDSAQEDFENQLRNFSEDEPLEIRHFGIDMSLAKNRLIGLLTKRLPPRSTTIKLLMISKDIKTYPPRVRPYVDEWAKLAGRSVNSIRTEVQALNEQYGKSKKFLEIDIHSYSEVPTIHGFSVYKNNRRWVTYFSVCRWIRNSKGDLDLDWGGHDYWKVPALVDHALSKDMIEIFEGAFDALWQFGRELPPIVIGVAHDKTKRRSTQPPGNVETSSSEST